MDRRKREEKKKKKKKKKRREEGREKKSKGMEYYDFCMELYGIIWISMVWYDY